MLRLTAGRKRILRVMTRQIVHARLAYFNSHYGLNYRRVFVRDQRTRWGSCSVHKNLNFNLRIALLPPELQDYIIAHELCHTRELNHSPAFWSLLGQAIPNPKQVSKALKRHRLC